jgi:peptide/nickel transport system substrate-binding protein
LESDNYWTRIDRRAVSRRRFLKGATALGVGAAGVTLAACGGGGEGEAPKPKASPTAAGLGLEPAKAPGSLLRFYSYEPLPIDTIDPHQTQFGPTYDMHGAVFSKVLKYDSVYDSIIGTDLAVSIPEVADEITYVIKIHPGATFHDTPTIRNNLKDIAPELPGRELTAEDIKYSIERQVNPNSPKSALYYRASQWATVDKIEVVDDYTLRITTKSPTAPFIHFLADSNAFIIAKELVDAGDEMNDVTRMVGTGPFILDKFVALQISRGLRNPTWFAQGLLADQGLPNRPIVDLYEANWYIGDPTAMEAAFKGKQVDGFGTDDPDIVRRVASDVGMDMVQTLGSGLINSRILCNDSPATATPFKDVRLRRAIGLAVDRNRMVQQMLSGGAYPCGPVAQAVKKWAFTPAELATKPGYRFGTQEREEDIAEAKKLWEAAGGSAVPKISVVTAGIPTYIPSFFPQFQLMLKDVLGLDVEMDLDPTGYTKLAQGFVEERIFLSLGFDNGWNDLDDYCYPYFHTDGAKNSFNLSDSELDSMLDKERAEFDDEARRQIGFQIQDYLLENVAGMHIWVSTINSSVNWSYLKNNYYAPWFGNSFHRADEWIDQTDPTFQGRPA